MKRRKGGFWLRAKAIWNIASGKRSVYSAAESTRLTADWPGTSLFPADDEMRWSISKIRSRARDLERNNPTIRNYLRILAVNVIGPKGVELEAKVRNNSGDLSKLINEKIEAGWDEWSQSCTRDGKMALPVLSRLILKSVARDGEAFVRIWRGYEKNAYQFALELIDPVLIDINYSLRSDGTANSIHMGIEVDSDGRPVAYYVLDAPYSSLGIDNPLGRKRIPASDIIHLYDPDRMNQTRGVSWLASVMVPSKMLDGYTEAELVAARVGAAKMGFFQRKDGTDPGNLPEGTEDGSLTMEANPGAFGILPEGYEIADFNVDHPNAGFGAFVKTAMRFIASGLGVSYNALASDLEGVNYSSLRSGLLIERDMWRCYQEWWIGAFLRPVYREWLNVALLSGKLVLDSRDFRKFLDIEWIPRGWAWVDPLKDTQAGVDGVANGLISRQMLLAEQGIDIEDVLEQLSAEAKMADELGIDISGGVISALKMSGTKPANTTDEGDTTTNAADEHEHRNGDSILARLHRPRF